MKLLNGAGGVPEHLVKGENFLAREVRECYKIFPYICLLNRLKKSIILVHLNNIPWN